jgi:protein-S-isoprenylcysteine O-methyltransferase Ste14
MGFLAALFALRILEVHVAGGSTKIVVGDLKSEDQSRLTTWILGATFLTNIIVPIWEYRYPKPIPELPWWGWLGLLIMVAGSALRIWSIRTSGESFKEQVAVATKQRLATTGPYARVRHPAYLGLIISYLGVTMIFSSALGLAALLVLVVPTIVFRIFKEEKILSAHFGEEWRRYTAQTGSMLFPGL